MSNHSPAHDLTTESGLRSYLLSRDPPVQPKEIKLLRGGTANYVYRAVLQDGTSVIYKHAAPYLHSNPEFAFDVRRMDYEDLALRLVPEFSIGSASKSNSGNEKDLNVRVHAVERYSYDSSAKLLGMSDGGSQNLKDAYAGLETREVTRIGEELGKWLSLLHSSTRGAGASLSTRFQLGEPQVPESRNEKEQGNVEKRTNNPIAVAIYRYSYMNLHHALVEYDIPGGRELAQKVDETFGGLLKTEHECLCHGDFWTGNVLVKKNAQDTDAQEAESRAREQIDLTVVDWEMARIGTSATDVAQFCAEAFFLDRFRGGKGLRSAFLNSYLRNRLSSPSSSHGQWLNRNWLRRLTVHWAVHVAFWPTRVDWADKEETRKLVEIGARVLGAAVEGNWEGLRRAEVWEGIEGVEKLWMRE